MNLQYRPLESPDFDSEITASSVPYAGYFAGFVSAGLNPANTPQIPRKRTLHG